MNRKNISIFILLILFSCQNNELFNNYKQISAKWQLDLNNNIDINVKKEINFIDMSICKRTKRGTKDEKLFCTASINDSEFGGLTIAYRLKLNNQINISSIEIVPASLPSGVVIVVQKTEIEKLLEKELVGIWTYSIDANKMIWERPSHKIMFTKL